MDICVMFARCYVVMFALGVIVDAWRKWPRNEEDRWDDSPSGLSGFFQWFDFF